MPSYYRPLLSTDPIVPSGALAIGGGWAWATHAQRISRGASDSVVPVSEIPDEVRLRLSAPRRPFAGLAMDRPRLMAILNATPDSFSDGGQSVHSVDAISSALAMIEGGADLIDIGGESTRPGAKLVPEREEIARVLPVVSHVAQLTVTSIDTRKSTVARAALDEGTRIVNDVSALTFDPRMADLVAQRSAYVVLTHARGVPETMQDEAEYENVLLDVYDELAARVAGAEAAGISRDRIAIDPGIGFAKTAEHNCALLSGLSLFHCFGCPIVLGASRKKFIGKISGVKEPKERLFGSIGVALAAVAQGVQILRVHDTVATKQAIALWQASRGQ